MCLDAFGAVPMHAVGAGPHLNFFEDKEQYCIANTGSRGFGEQFPFIPAGGRPCHSAPALHVPCGPAEVGRPPRFPCGSTVLGSPSTTGGRPSVASGSNESAATHAAELLVRAPCLPQAGPGRQASTNATQARACRYFAASPLIYELSLASRCRMLVDTFVSAAQGAWPACHCGREGSG